jgi:hypothetical protein
MAQRLANASALLFIEQTGFETETDALFDRPQEYIAASRFCAVSLRHAQDETPFSGDLQLPGIVNYAPANVSAGALAQGPASNSFSMQAGRGIRSHLKTG